MEIYTVGWKDPSILAYDTIYIVYARTACGTGTFGLAIAWV